MKLVDAEAKLQELIISNEKHQDYKRVTEYAELMKQLITGEGIEELLHQFVRREDAEMFEQRKILTQIITPSICKTLMTPAYKIPRVKPIVKKIDFDTQKTADNGAKKTKTADVETMKTKLSEAMAKYYGNAGIDGYLEKRFIPLSYIDPNGFILTTFDKFDNKFEVARPYPTFIPCKDAIHFDISDNVLNWLLIMKGSSEYVNALDEGSVFQMYTPTDVIEYIEVSPEKFIGIEGETEYTDGQGNKFVRLSNAKVFQALYYTPKAGDIQAFRIGTFLDESTEGRTCVSPIDAAVPYLKKSIKVCSELDLSTSLHVFLQKIMYQPPCPGESATVGCMQGRTSGGEVCGLCGGTGRQEIKSAQDAIYLTMPRDPNDAYDLAKIIHYQDLPMDIVEFLAKHLDNIEVKAVKAVYNSELFTTSTVVTTATEKNVDMQSIYDALYPIAKKYSEAWVHIVKLVSHLIDIPQIIAEHQFPKDFKFRSQEDLLILLKLAADSNAPSYVKQDISNDIAQLMFQDRPDELKKIIVRQKFNPFDGKNIDEINFIISNDLCTQHDKILWSAASVIFNELEEDSLTPNTDNTVTTQKAWFYDLTYVKQKEAIDLKIEEIITQIKEDTPQAIVFGAGGIPTDVAPGGAPAPVA